MSRPGRTTPQRTRPAPQNDVRDSMASFRETPPSCAPVVHHRPRERNSTTGSVCRLRCSGRARASSPASSSPLSLGKPSERTSAFFPRDGKAAASSAVSLSGRGVNLGAPPPRNVNNDIVFVLFFTLLKKGHRNLSSDTRRIRREGERRDDFNRAITLGSSLLFDVAK